MLVDALSFELAGSRYALLTSFVTEVVRAVAIEALPSAPGIVSGVINLRGQVIAVVDMRRRLGLPPRPVVPEDYFIIVELNGLRLALHVDRALDLLNVSPIPLARVAPSPFDEARYIAGVVPTGEGVLLVQDLPAFLSHADSVQLGEALRARHEHEQRSAS
ncbi:MAG: chemotaxis protein CheW [Polyangiales bacterium]